MRGSELGTGDTHRKKNMVPTVEDSTVPKRGQPPKKGTAIQMPPSKLCSKYQGDPEQEVIKPVQGSFAKTF